MLIQMKCSAQDEAVRFQRFTSHLKERDRIIHKTLLQVHSHHGPAAGQIGSHTYLLHHSVEDPLGTTDLSFLQKGKNQVAEVRAGWGYVAVQHHLNGFLSFCIEFALCVCSDHPEVA
ncbi:hypothetical protein SETIT_4G009700v2 [Setaria italica]|uniref:Uncharacterized protein n=1 Tax=Setaria italica TaxID=4555 RepID=A0A368QPE9_SETIT|nr:hypothetical protein SETIT_4G009700v2 [Setaria italica]